MVGSLRLMRTARTCSGRGSFAVRDEIGMRDVADVAVGDSIAINGCCLTVVKLTASGKGKLAQFDLLKETWRRTNLQFAQPGSLVNLERPLRSDA